MILLAGDIGGTHSRLICADVQRDNQRIVAEKNYLSHDYSDLLQVIELFLTEYKIKEPLQAACFAVAGPVKKGIAAITNLPWVISEKDLSQRLHIPQVKLVNDFIAVVYGIEGIEELDSENVLMLQKGEVDNVKPDAIVIGAGTGLGVAYRVWRNDHYQAFSTEAGHGGFAPENEQQCRLLSWLQKQHSHVSLELILSGRGLLTIYQFLREHDQETESRDVLDAMKKSDPSQVITEYALSNQDELCQKTLDMFIDIYGASAGNAALHFYPVDEVYIAGGIAPKIRDKIIKARFVDAFNHKGLMSSNMKKMTIKLILEEKAGLYGAIATAIKMTMNNNE